MSGEREEMQQGAYRLADEGKPYFRCVNAKTCNPGPTVVDEDGCCVYCGVTAVVALSAGTPRGSR